MEIIIVGINYNKCPVNIRESLTFPNVEDAISKLLSNENIKECLLLSTCNRNEIYALTQDLKKCEEDLKVFFYSYHNLANVDLNEYFYVYSHDRAVSHLFSVTSGLDSMVLGEPQITGQVKEAYMLAKSKNSIGKIFHKLINSAFTANKEVRSNTQVAKGAVSVSYAACEIAKKILDPLSSKSTLLIGGGEMIRLAALQFKSSNIKNLAVSNRTQANINNFKEEFNAQIIPFESFRDELYKYDIIVVCTGAPNYIITSENLRAAMEKRKNAPLFVVDISVPRNVDPKSADILNLFLYNIDDLKFIIEENKRSREKELEKAKEIIKDNCDGFIAWFDLFETDQFIAKLAKAFNSIGEDDLTNYLPFVELVNKTGAKFILESETVTKKDVFRKIIVKIKKEQDLGERERIINIIETVFKLNNL